MGIVGGLLIAKWAWGLLRSSALILLDGNKDRDIQTAIESDGDSVVADLHVWPLNADDLAAGITVVSKACRCPSEYCFRLSHLPRLKHTTVETHVNTDEF